VGTRAEAAVVLAQVVPGARIEVPASARPPRRAALRNPLRYRYLAAWHDGSYVLARTGRVARRLVVLPIAKTQSIRLVQGPVLRRLGLANVHVDAAGRSWGVSALGRDATDARRLLEEVALKARAARAGAGSRRAGPPWPGSPEVPV
jgi:putative membrane protein